MKPVDVKPSAYIESSKETNDEDTKFKIGDIVRISKYKNILAKCYVPDWSEEVFVIKKVKNTVLWTYVISDLNGEEIVGTFYKKELQKTNQKEFRVGKVINKKGDLFYFKWKGYDSSFNSSIDKKYIVEMSEYVPKPKSLGGRVKVELDLSNHATKSDLKNATGVDTSKFAKKLDLANLKSSIDKLDVFKLKNVPTDSSNLKSKVDELDVDKLVRVPVDLSKLSDSVKKDVYNAKIKNI